MSQTLELLVLLTALGLVVGVSALAGAIWGQVHGWPRARALRLAEELAERLKALEARPSPAEPIPAPTVRHRADPPAPSAIAGPMLIEVPELPRAAGSGGGAAAAELAARFGTIWALADDGASPEVIARRTGQPIGQVELVLGLRRQLSVGPRERG
ncbi:MAG TPA: hypothetical protein VG406_13680 [Isosphaeraceae bacterium]|jgi:alkanesulfonate monooxygenase SsuD/methylene tetrahydromethanopterin reductase-like flavin-dependent oxidoreductase (luciferase family)|nr:hypothetical protein [Isosphaeraceae bacterium]